MNIADFDFDLPDELIAQEPSPTRGESRLLVLQGDSIVHTTFPRIVDAFRSGDLLVVNDTKVFPARLLGRRVPSGGAVECLLLEEQGPLPPNPEGTDVGGSRVWYALVHPGHKLKPGSRVIFEGEGAVVHGEVLARHFHGRRSIRLWTDDGGSIDDAVDRLGHVPLPPYITRADRPADRDRYQTVFARERGSVAAPTAGLHFTSSLLDALRSRGVERAEVTLHVGYGTFKPVSVTDSEDHTVDAERFTVSPSTAAALSRARREHRRVIAVGTTTARALESLPVDENGTVAPAGGTTDLFIHPGHAFRIVDGLVTNFHLPRSSLLMLVAAFAGRERILRAYGEAIARGYRFYSYGDAMLIV